MNYTVLAHVRKQARRQTTLLGDWPDDLACIEDQSFNFIATNELSLRVRELISGLSRNRDRELLVMTYLHEKPKKEICGTLEVSPAQFDRLIYRAKKRLYATIVGLEEKLVE